MTKINLHFGNPTSDKSIAQNEEWAFNHEISIEKANLQSFNAVMKALTRKNDHDQNYFDLSFISLTGFEAVSPLITFDSYTFNRTKYPRLTIHGDYLIEAKTNKEIFITDEFIERIGLYVEEDFDYEFIEFKRSGKIKARNNDVVYLINGKLHVHHNGKFIPIK